jgi:hypothetical protein
MVCSASVGGFSWLAGRRIAPSRAVVFGGPREAGWAARGGPQAPRGPSSEMWNNQAETENG